jgi:hypothetical protein
MNKDKQTTEDQSEEVNDVNQTSADSPVRTINDHVAKVLNIKIEK